MENKRSFVLYADSIHVVRKLSDEKAGQLLKLILAYVNDENPTVDDPLLEIAFEPIKQQLKRDLIRWQSIREKRSESGRLAGIKSGESRRNKKEIEPNEPNGSFTNQTNENERVNVNVNDNVINNKTSKIDFDDLLLHFNTSFRKHSNVFADRNKRLYLARLKDGYTIEQIKLAMSNAAKDQFHVESGFKHCTLEFFTRAEKIDKFAFTATKNISNGYNPRA